jgi:hypothetical protein
MKRFTDEDIRLEVAALAVEIGTRQLAKRLGVSPAFVSLVTMGKAKPGPTVAAALGYVDDGKRWIKDRGR